MTLEEDGGHRNGQDVRDNVLDGVSIGGGQGHRRSPLVVLLVYSLVEVLVVQSRMGVVKEGLLQQLEKGKLPQEGEKRRPLSYASETLFAVHAEVDKVGDVADDEAQEDDVEYDLFHHFPELFHLQGFVGSELSVRPTGIQY